MNRLARILLPGALAIAATASAHADFGGEDDVIALTQVECQFLESENGVDHGFESSSKSDCQRINNRTGDERLQNQKVLRLEPGTYTFKVTNKDVPYTLGFWLREKGYDPGSSVDKLTKTSVSGGGLDAGETDTYEVKLEPGEYVYSCPLNPTPNYRLIVEG